MVGVVVVFGIFIIFWLLIFGGTAKKYEKSGLVDDNLPCKKCRHCDNCLHQGDLMNLED